MKAIKSSFILLAFALLMPSEGQASMTLQLGQGEAQLEIESAVGAPQQLEFKISDPELNSLIGSAEVYNFSWDDKDLEQKLLDQENSRQKIVGELIEKIKTDLQNENYEKESYPAQGAIFSDDESRQRVVMGSYALVEEGESLKDLTVVGGKVDLRGEVESLVIIGGFVRLLETARVVKEIVIVGGHVEELPGSKILGKRIDLSMPGGDDGWGILRDKIKNWLFKDLEDNFLLKVFGFLLKFFVLIVFFAVGQYWAPNYHTHVQSYLRHHFWLAAIWGLLTVVLVLPATLFLTLSIVGIPLLPLQFSLLFLFVIYGEIHIAQYFVRKIPQLKDNLYWATILGLFFIEFVAYFAGLSFLKWTLVLIGFGAASKIFYKRTLPALSKA